MLAIDNSPTTALATCSRRCWDSESFAWDLRGIPLFFAADHYQREVGCPVCGAELSLLRVAPEGSVWFGSVDSAIEPAAIPVSVPAEVRASVSAELAPVLDRLIASCQHFGRSVGAKPTINAIYHSPGTQAAALIRALPGAIRGKLAVMGADAWKPSALVQDIVRDGVLIEPGRGRATVLGGRYSWLDWIREDGVRDTLELLDAFMPRENDTWPLGLSLSVGECRYVADSISGFRSGMPQIAPVAQQIILIPGPDRVHVHSLDQAGSFLIGERNAEGEMLVTGQIAAHRSQATAALLAELEELINDPRTAERTLEAFLAQHAATFFGEALADIRRQLTLRPEVQLTGTSSAALRPDFFVRRDDSPLWDIVELKLPRTRLLRRQGLHHGFAATVTRAVDQLRAYYDYFQDETNRQQFREFHGLDVYQPNLTLVMGRASEFRSPHERRRLERELTVAGSPVKLVTYDDLLRIGRSRRFFLDYDDTAF